MLTLSEAVRIVQALDEADFRCVLDATAEHDAEGRRTYEVRVRLEGEDVDRLAYLRGVLDAVPDAYVSPVKGDQVTVT